MRWRENHMGTVFFLRIYQLPQLLMELLAVYETPEISQRLTCRPYACYMSYKSQLPIIYQSNNFWQGVQMHLMQFPAVFSWPVDEINVVETRVPCRAVLCNTESDVCLFRCGRMAYGSCLSQLYKILRVLGWIFLTDLTWFILVRHTSNSIKIINAVQCDWYMCVFNLSPFTCFWIWSLWPKHAKDERWKKTQHLSVTPDGVSIWLILRLRRKTITTLLSSVVTW
jgi:hypothetical protein